MPERLTQFLLTLSQTSKIYYGFTLIYLLILHHFDHDQASHQFSKRSNFSLDVFTHSKFFTSYTIVDDPAGRRNLSRQMLKLSVHWRSCALLHSLFHGLLGSRYDSTIFSGFDGESLAKILARLELAKTSSGSYLRLFLFGFQNRHA